MLYILNLLYYLLFAFVLYGYPVTDRGKAGLTELRIMSGAVSILRMAKEVYVFSFIIVLTLIF